MKQLTNVKNKLAWEKYYSTETGVIPLIKDGKKCLSNSVVNDINFLKEFADKIHWPSFLNNYQLRPKTIDALLQSDIKIQHYVNSQNKNESNKPLIITWQGPIQDYIIDFLYAQRFPKWLFNKYEPLLISRAKKLIESNNKHKEKRYIHWGYLTVHNPTSMDIEFFKRHKDIIFNSNNFFAWKQFATLKIFKQNKEFFNQFKKQKMRFKQWA